MVARERKKRKEVKIFTLDTETRGLEGNMFRIGLYDGKQYYTGYEYSDVTDVFDKYKDKECHVYVHNLDFDISKIINELEEHSDIEFSNCLFINGNIVTYHSNKIILHDSYRLLPSSLEKLSKDFGLEAEGKMDIMDYIKENGFAVYYEEGKKKGQLNERKSKEKFFKNVDRDDPLLNEYMKLDCIALYKIIEIVQQLSKIELESFVLCPTTASLSLRIFKEKYKKDYKTAISTNYYSPLGRDVERFIRQGYYGGRTEVFTPRIFNGYHYDVNSLYPYVMKMAELPVGFPIIAENGEDIEIHYKQWKRRRYGAGFIQAKVYVPDMFIPVLPKKDATGKLIFPVGRIEGVWTYPELELAEKEGCVIESYEGGVYFEKTAPVFRDFILQFEEIKKNSEGAKRTFAKLVQNSLYGKFAMQRERLMYASYDAKDELESEGYEPYTIEYKRNGLDFKFLEYLGEINAEYIQPHLSAYITSFARMELYKGLRYMHQKGILGYCDTDSCAGTVQIPEKMVDDKEYGKWKLEGLVIEGIYLQPKMYAENTIFNGKTKEVVKMKGVPRQIIKEDIDFQQFKKWYYQVKQGAEQIQVYESNLQVRKFLSKIKNDIDMNELMETKKSINFAREQKRHVDYKKNTTSPLERHDYGDKKDDINVGAFDDWRNKVESFNDDISSIEEQVIQIGKIKTPVKSQKKFLAFYKQLSARVRYNYFSIDGVDINEWCKQTGWTKRQLFEQLSYM
ncbi:hypothetical protein FOT98_18360 [Bacillus sp. HY001]|uniref:DNA polymerase n=1 Tax=Bacillus TaxID=1386 RepID=UPI0011862DDE|nr:MULTISPECIES: DNA polymerase [Bacillus]TSI12486.1 hypothetical protein FOT98_18360 [Bacillus sp. HY001]